jgi:hypothetical protein
MRSAAKRIASVLVRDRGDGRRGSTTDLVAEDGKRAVTHIKPVAQLSKEGGATLVEVRLETGRQHQIRLHLAHLGLHGSDHARRIGAEFGVSEVVLGGGKLAARLVDARQGRGRLRLALHGGHAVIVRVGSRALFSAKKGGGNEQQGDQADGHYPSSTEKLRFLPGKLTILRLLVHVCN